MKHTIGFFINPVAGMGGSVGLKGTDNMAEQARTLGAEEIAPARAGKALSTFFDLLSTENPASLNILTSGDRMGETVCRKALENAEVSSKERVNIINIHTSKTKTTAKDTIEFCSLAMEKGAELILFAGGDGTTRDVVSAVGEELPILGIPSGVKMHSGVFARTPDNVGGIVMEFLSGRAEIETREIVDLDENAYRSGNIRTKLFGFARVPVTTQVQGCKNVVSGVDDDADRKSIALGIEEFMEKHDGIYIMGAGSTLRDIGNYLGLELTPLGFDVVGVENGRSELLKRDVNEKDILETLKDTTEEERYLIITPIGAQGFILGRGTQVVSSHVLSGISDENIIVVATPGKLAITPALHVDIGEQGEKMRGFRKVMIGYRRFVLKKVM